MAESVIIRNRPIRASITVLIWGVESLAGVYLARLGIGWLGQAENGMAVLTILGGILLAAAGAVMTDIAWQAARLGGGPAITLTGSGIIDHRLSAIELAWRDVSYKIVFNGRAHSLQFDLSPIARASYRVSWGNRVMGLLNRAFGYPEFTLATLATGLSTHALGQLMEESRA